MTRQALFFGAFFGLIGAVGFRQRGADESAASALGFDEAECFQFVVGFFDSEWRDHQLFAQFTMRGELVAGLQATARDGVGDLPHDLAVEGKLTGRIDEQIHA